MSEHQDSNIAFPQGAGFVGTSAYNPTIATVRIIGGKGHPLVALSLKDEEAGGYVATVALTAEAWEQVIASVQAVLAEMSVSQ